MIKEILIEQNSHWNGEVRPSIKRDKLKQLISYLPLKQIITISGIRRCGKSTLARQTIQHLIESGVPTESILFVNLENPAFLEFRHNPNYLHTIYEAWLKLLNPQGRHYIIFDEIQFFENWQVYIKSQYEQFDHKYIITGSNSSMLSNELTTLLSGRSLNIHLDTFSFREFLDYKTVPHASELEQIKYRIDIARAKEEYLKWGGFYEVMAIDDPVIKKELLTNYAKNILYQDIMPRYGIRNSEIVERLFFYLLSHTGSVLNYTSLSQIFGVSAKTIREYILYFEDVFLMHRIDKFHNKPKERIKSSRKIYTLDNGFLQIAPRHSEDRSKALENLVFNTLFQKDKNLYYLRETYEVDFYDGQTLCQVAWDINNPKTRKRELAAFSYFPESKNRLCQVITWDNNEQNDIADIISLDRLLLSDTNEAN